MVIFVLLYYFVLLRSAVFFAMVFYTIAYVCTC
jgi:hypothetical protein